MAVIRDVADKAGVSTGTVSKFFSNPSNLREENRKRIEQAVHELKYHPSNTARSLRTQRTKLFALIVPDIVNPFYAAVYDAVRVSASHYKYKPILYTTEDDLELLRDYLEGNYIHEVDGAIICFLDEDEIVSDFERIRHLLPLVLLSSDLQTKTDSVVVDWFEVVYKSTKHLLQLGRREIAYIGGPANSRISREKQRGFEKAISEAGSSLRPEHFFEGRYHFQTGYEAGVRFMRLSQLPTGVVAANDAIAIGCMKYFLQKGIRIPEDIAVIGSDDILLASMYEPSLSSVHIATGVLGEEAVKILMSRIEKPRSRSRKIVLSTDIVVRQSTDKGTPQIVEF